MDIIISLIHHVCFIYSVVPLDLGIASSVISASLPPILLIHKQYYLRDYEKNKASYKAIYHQF